MNAKLENNDNKREEAEAEAEAAEAADEGIQLEPGCGFVLCTGGAMGTNQLAEELGLQYGVKVEVIIPPGHPRKRTVTPLHPRVLTLANPHLEVAAARLGKRLPIHKYVLHLLQRNFEIVRRADTVYAFGILEDDCTKVLGGTGWTVQLALDQGKKVFVYDIESEAWFHSVYGHKAVEGGLDIGIHFIPWTGRDKPVLHQNSAVVGARISTRTLEKKSKISSNVRSLHPPNPPRHGK